MGYVNDIEMLFFIFHTSAKMFPTFYYFKTNLIEHFYTGLKVMSLPLNVIHINKSIVAYHARILVRR